MRASLAVLSQYGANPRPTPHDGRRLARLQCRICCIQKRLWPTKQRWANEQQADAAPKDALVLFSHLLTTHLGGARCLSFLPGFPASVTYQTLQTVPF
jgi:hypothetical protein